MDSSALYIKKIGKLFKKNYDKDVDTFKDELKNIFTDTFNWLGDDVASEIYMNLVEYSERDYKEAVYNLVNVFEMFEENYDVENNPLNDREWDYIKMIVNSNADDLKLDDIKYIMQLLLDMDRL